MRRAFLISDCKRLLASGNDEQKIVIFLREQGCSVIESIAIVSKSMDLDLNAAKKLVHFSKAWEDMREAHDKLHEDLEQAIANKE
jgi:hypothetical protein